MKNEKKQRAIISITILLFIFAVARISGCRMKSNKYDVEIVFCDNRESVKVTFYGHMEPSAKYIQNSRNAVPEFRLNGKTYLNVCDVKVKQ